MNIKTWFFNLTSLIMAHTHTHQGRLCGRLNSLLMAAICWRPPMTASFGYGICWHQRTHALSRPNTCVLSNTSHASVHARLKVCWFRNDHASCLPQLLVPQWREEFTCCWCCHFCWCGYDCWCSNDAAVALAGQRRGSVSSADSRVSAKGIAPPSCTRAILAPNNVFGAARASDSSRCVLFQFQGDDSEHSCILGSHKVCDESDWTNMCRVHRTHGNRSHHPTRGRSFVGEHSHQQENRSGWSAVGGVAAVVLVGCWRGTNSWFWCPLRFEGSNDRSAISEQKLL